MSVAHARPVAIAGEVLHPIIETKTLPSGREGLPVWFLARLGVSVHNAPDDLQLTFGPRTLQYTPAGWRGTRAATTGLSAPELFGGSLHVPLDVLRALGVPVLADAPDVLDLAATVPGMPTPTTTPAPTRPVTSTPTPTPSAPTPPPAAGAQLASVRSSRTLNRNLETQRVVLEFSGTTPYQVTRDKTGLTVTLPGTTGQPATQKLESGDTLGVALTATGLSVRLETRGGTSELFTLQDPFRVVVDTVTNINPNVPPPPDYTHLPDGVTRRQVGALHLLSFDPARFVPRVVTAPLGTASPLADHIRRVGGVAGVNGGYFDPASNLPVDLVAQGGLMLAPSLERRGTIGFDALGNVRFGVPRPRYVLTGAFGTLTVNTVSAKGNPALLTAFVGDGRTGVGGPGLTTLTLDGTRVLDAYNTPFVPAAGTLTVTYNADKYPQLPRTPGAALGAALTWQAPAWTGTREALSAGPVLVAGGRVALNPQAEGFNTNASIWRATRQVAFAVYGGQPTIAYLESGTPDAFARALAAAGVTDAVRLDSGSSATVFVAGGYLNTVWSRPVPNAIVLVPRQNASAP